MLNPKIKEYLSRVGVRKVNELDTALVETFGEAEGEKHIERLTELFDRSEERLLCGSGDTPFLRRQGELVDYLNQSLAMSLLAASYYDHVFFKRVMEYLLKYDSFWGEHILDIGCGNGILTCFLAQEHSGCVIEGVDLSSNAVCVARELAGKLGINNVHFVSAGKRQKGQCDTLFSCRTVHENVAWRGLIEERNAGAASVEEQAAQYSAYAGELEALVKENGYLVSVEHYGDESAHAALSRALKYAGFCQVRGTSMQFSCKNGDDTAVFQAMVFQKIGTEKIYNKF